MGKPKKKSKPKKSPLIGHNSDDAMTHEELRKIAKAQRTLDKEKASVKKEWREREKKLTERLQEVGFTRDQFKAPYKRYCELADCDNDNDAETVRQQHIVFLAQQRKAFDALSQGESIDWIQLVQDGDEIIKLQEQQAAAADKEAAESENVADAEDTPTEI